MSIALAPKQLLFRWETDAGFAACGCAIQDYTAADLGAVRGIALRETPLQSGRCDYQLLVDRRPVDVIEAKKAGVTLSRVPLPPPAAWNASTSESTAPSARSTKPSATTSGP